MMREKAAVAQQRARAAARDGARLQRRERLQAEADQRAQRCHAGDDPDQVRRRDDVDHHAAGERARDKRRRSPQPQRTVF